jgi:hypothetical protein
LGHQQLAKFSRCILPALIIFGMFFVVAGNQEVHAQGQGDVKLTVQAGFNGYCKENRWIPVRVTVENKGADLTAARIQVSGGKSIYAADISLPSTSRKELFLYLYPQDSLGKLNVSVMMGDQTLVTTSLNISCISGENLVIGLLTDTPSAYNSLNETNSLSSFVHITQLQLADLPDRSQGWEGLDALVVSGLDMGPISDAQRAALNAWLAQGGKLLIVGGPKWQSVAGGLDEFLPLDLKATQNLNNLSSLQSYFKIPATLDGNALVAVGQLRPNAEVLVEQAGVPLIIQKPIGFGKVYYLAADPALQPLSNWDGMKVVYSDLLGTRSLHPSWTDSSWDSYSANQALATLPALGLPSAFYVFCLLGLYILIIGPLNYFILRKIKRQELAWISIPVLVILFTLAAYFSGYLIRGTRPILNRLTVAQAWDGVPQAQVHALVGIYSPSRTKYALQAGDSFLPYPFGKESQTLQANQDWLSLQNGPEIVLPDVLVESGGIKAAALNGSIPAISFSHDLVISLGKNDPVLNGTITNTSKYTLKDAMLVLPDRPTKQLGNFAPGAAKQVQVLLSASPDGSDIYNLQAQMYYSNTSGAHPDDKAVRQNALIRAVMSAGDGKGNAGIYLIGWIDDPLLPTSLQGQLSDSIDTTLYVLMLSPKIDLKPGLLKLSPGMFIWESSNPDIAPYSPSSSQNIPASGYVLSFKLAIPLRYSLVKSLTLSMNRNNYSNANGPDGIGASLWDWEHAGWVQIENLAWGDIDIPNASQFVGPAGEIRLKIDKNGQLSQNWNEIQSSYVTLVVEP